MWMRPVAKMASARSMYCVWWIKRDRARWRWKSCCMVSWLANGCSHAHQVLQTSNRDAIDAAEREAVACRIAGW